MDHKSSDKRLTYFIVFIALVFIEVLIALFVHDRFIRPYVGDILVVGVIYSFVRIFFPNKPKLLPLYVFLFSAAVEIGQYFDFVSLLGLGDSRFFRILLGTSFSWGDILCYAIGALFCFGMETAVKKPVSHGNEVD